MRLELHVRDVGITVETGQQIWETARKLVQTEGMEVTHPRLRADLAGKPGLDVSGDRVRIAPDLFEEHYPSPETKRARLQANPPPPPDTKPRPFRLSCGGYSMDVVDWHTGAIRPATVRDLIESVRLAEAFDSSGPYCVTPQDVPPFLQDIATYKTCFEHAKTIRGYYYSSPVQAPFIEQMCAVMGEQFDVILGVVSPLKMSNSDLDNLYRTIDEGKTYPVRLVGYGVPGIATPAKLAASSALVMAENYAAVLLLELALPEHSIGRPGAHGGGATDFRHCCYALGAPHTFAYNLINLYIMHAIEGQDPEKVLSMRNASMHTGACEPDEQAAAEKSALALLGALMGARRFGSAGNLCVDDVYSLEQFVIDAWIARHAVHTVEAGLSSAVMADLGGFFEELAAVMSGDNILGQPSTLEVMNAFRRSHTGFEHMKLREWQGGGSRAMRNKAREIITAKLAEPHFVLDPAKASELNRVYAAAEKALG